MTNASLGVRANPSNRFVTVVAWGTMLSVSVLPNALLHELRVPEPPWLVWAKMGLLLALAVATFFWSVLRSIRHFFLVVFAIFATEEIVSRVTSSIIWQGWFAPEGAGFTRTMLGEQLGRLTVALLIVGVLLGLGYRRREFFLVRGQLDAPITPVGWLGFPEPVPWTHFGKRFSLYIAGVLLVFLIASGRPSLTSVVGAIPMLPAVVLLAAMNAFSEEMTYKASMLATLEPAVGSRHALWNTALFFGIGHYFGVPYGVIGVIMASFLGWILGKAMLETRGFFWAWFIHFIQDILIFYLMAIGSIAAGGS